LDDNNWHSIRYTRRAHEIRLTVDNVTVKSNDRQPSASDESTTGVKTYFLVDDSDMEDEITLKWQGLLVGGLPPKDPDAMASLPSFIGSIQQFVLNKIDYFELGKISTRGCKYLEHVASYIRVNAVNVNVRTLTKSCIFFFLRFVRSFGRLTQSADDLEIPKTRETAVVGAHDYVPVEEHVRRPTAVEGLLPNGGVLSVQDQTRVRHVFLQRRQA